MLPSRLDDAGCDAVPVSRTKSERCRIDEQIEILEKCIAQLRNGLSDVLAEPVVANDKAQGKLEGSPVHELHGWLRDVGTRVEHIVDSVRDMNVRLDL